MITTTITNDQGETLTTYRDADRNLVLAIDSTSVGGSRTRFVIPAEQAGDYLHWSAAL